MYIILYFFLCIAHCPNQMFKIFLNNLRLHTHIHTHTHTYTHTHTHDIPLRCLNLIKLLFWFSPDRGNFTGTLKSLRNAHLLYLCNIFIINIICMRFCYTTIISLFYDRSCGKMTCVLILYLLSMRTSLTVRQFKPA